jgi:hypothetical protein
MDRVNVAFSNTMGHDVPFWGILLNCALLTQSSLQISGRQSDKGIFYALACISIVRLLLDIVCRDNMTNYHTLLGLVVVCEFIVLDSIVRRMCKYSTTPRISMIIVSVSLLVVDISYILNLVLPNDFVPEA